MDVQSGRADLAGPLIGDQDLGSFSGGHRVPGSVGGVFRFGNRGELSTGLLIKFGGPTMPGMESNDPKFDSGRNQTDRFATTHWSLVRAAGERGDVESDRALESLCRAYWPPLYAYVRRRVNSIHEAQDLTQAFFERLLEKHYLAQATPERGRFRSYLITAFKHFLSREWDKAKAQKRGAGRAVFSLDFVSQDSSWIEHSDEVTADRLYERQWAITLLNRVLNRLQREMERDGKGRQYQSLKGFLGGSGDSSYAAAAVDLGVSESAARMTASRMRGRYRELLRDEIAQTVSSQEDIENEVRHLFAIFSN